MRYPFAATFIALSVLTATLRAADSALPDAPTGYSLTAVESSQLKSTTVIYETIHASIKEQGEPIRKALHELFAKIQVAKIAPVGGPIFIYKTIAQNPDEPLDIDVAIPVVDNTPAPEGCQSRVLASSPSMTGIFKGPVSALGRAYSDFFRQLQRLGKVPAGELRQRNLYYEDEGSANNIVFIEMQTSD